MKVKESGENILIAIPARGGSKRLPRKNIALLGDKPMLAYSIEASLQSGLTDNVFVCTEDEEIERCALQYGAKIFRIPPEMAGDLVSSTDPCLDLYEELSQHGKKIDYIFTLQPTSPLRSTDDIRNSFTTFCDSPADFLVSVTPIDPHYFHWAFEEGKDGWKMYFGKEFMQERPLLPPIFRPNGAIKLASADKLKETGNFLFHDYSLTVHMMPEERSIHVATQFDLVCAKAMLQER